MWKWGLLVVLIGLGWVAPYLKLISSSPIIYQSLADIAPRQHQWAIVFGAGVASDGTLTDVVYERAKAAVDLYHQEKIQQVFVSGDNRQANQAQAIADFVISEGVLKSNVTIDSRGIDTHDTCRHFIEMVNDQKLEINQPILLLTQEFHFPRAAKFCEGENLVVEGLGVIRLGCREQRADNWRSLVITRINRFFRESTLSWLQLTGTYDLLSQEAEELEKNNPILPSP